MTGRLRLRSATPEDRDVLHAIAAETKGLPFPKEVLKFPTVECYCVETEDGEILGFGYLEAIPEAHVVLRRRGVSKKTKHLAVKVLHAAAWKIAKTLTLPAIRYPVRADAPELAIFLSSLPNVQADPRVHLSLVMPDGE